MVQKTKQYIGVLATTNDSRGEVYVTKNGSIQFRICVLNGAGEVDSIACFLNKFPETAEMENSLIESEKRIEAARNWLKNKVFFTFAKQKSDDYASATIIACMDRPENFVEERYVAVPVFAPSDAEEEKRWQEQRQSEWGLFRNYKTFEEWKLCIEQKESVGRIYGYQVEDVSESVVFWREEGKLSAVGPVEYWEFGMTGLMPHGKMDCIWDAEAERSSILYDEVVNPTLAFMTETVYKKVKKQLLGEEIFEEEFIETSEVEEYAGTIEEDAYEAAEEYACEIEKRKETQYEECIIGNMHRQCLKRRLNFRKRDLINFHLSVKCNPLVFLGGRGGTGKSTLMDIYISALGIHEKPENKIRQYSTIVVRPSWQDEVSFFGKPDYDNQIYRPSESGFIETLIYAQQNPEQLFFICLEEMNLSSPGMYLAPFLSVVHRKKAQRVIRLYQSGMKEYLKNSDFYPEVVYIGDNVRVIGILSEGEDAKPLSADMIRRANLIYLSEQTAEPPMDIVDFRWMCGERKGWTSTIYNGFTMYYEIYSKLLRRIVADVNGLLISVNPYLAISQKEEKEMYTYIGNAKNILDSDFAQNVATDYQIAQRMLSKIRGTAEEWETVLGTGEGSLMYLFEGYGQISNFEECKRVIQRKREEIRLKGSCQ